MRIIELEGWAGNLKRGIPLCGGILIFFYVEVFCMFDF
jgi:hypothetical protein